MPTTYRDVVKEAQAAVEDFSEYLPKLQKKTYARLQRIINKLELDADGIIQVSESNMALIDDIREELRLIPRDRIYQENVAGIKKTISDIQTLQTSYFATHFTDFLKPDVMKDIQQHAFKSAVASLTESGLDANVVNKAVDIVKSNVTSGSSFFDMTDKLKDFMLGTPEVDGKLHSYVKQIVNDTIHTVSRDYNAKVADDLGLEWFEYVGGLMKTSRPWCVAMEHKKYVHISELPAICRGEINGEKVSLEGLKPGTNKDNVQSWCGGYNCEHHMAPVPSAAVPTSLRRKFEPEVAPDEDETSEARPRNKRR